MDCRETKEYLYPFIDAQLDNETYLLVKEHLSTCPLCNLEWKQERAFDSLVRQNISAEKASLSLKETVLDRIKKEKALRPFPFVLPQIRGALAAIIVALLVTSISIYTLRKDYGSLPIFTESILSHTKFLQGALPLEFTSGKPNEIRDWFQGKLDFAVHISDFSRQGADLVGGRLCHLKGREAAHLIYQKDGHYLSVFVINTKGLRFPKAKKLLFGKRTLYLKGEKGYQSILCLEKGSEISCVFVSDLPEEELLRIII